MRKTNFTIHSISRVATWCMSLLLLFALNSSAQAQCNLVCNDHVNASMTSDPGCTRTLTAYDFLQNPGNCNYLVTLSYPFGTTTPSGPKVAIAFVDRSHLGYTFVYSVYTP
ncbi:MAG: hypothetical protein ABI844_13550, partial [Saprospiraceae bacterium]